MNTILILSKCLAKAISSLALSVASTSSALSAIVFFGEPKLPKSLIKED